MTFEDVAKMWHDRLTELDVHFPALLKETYRAQEARGVERVEELTGDIDITGYDDLADEGVLIDLHGKIVSFTFDEAKRLLLPLKVVETIEDVDQMVAYLRPSLVDLISELEFNQLHFFRSVEALMRFASSLLEWK